MIKRILSAILIISSLLMTACIAPTTPSSTPTTKPPTILQTGPSGIYVTTYYGIEETLTFKGNVLETYNVYPTEGKRVYTYSISQDGTEITLTNVVTGDVGTQPFKYIKEYECVVIGGQQYYRR